MSEIELTDQILRHSLEILRLSAGEQARADAMMIELIGELRMLLQSRDVSAATKRELTALIADAEKAINAKYAELATSVDTHELALIVAEKTAHLIEGVGATMPTAARLASLTKDVLIDGAPSSAWWSKQGEDTAFKFAAQVRQGVINNETQAQIVQRIVGKNGEPGIMDVARRNARSLVHSSVMNAANQARLASFRAMSAHIAGVRWLATLDGHTCVRCFPAGTMVLPAGTLKKVFRAEYQGQMFVVTTAAGKKLKGTPNHPILTARGFLSLSELKEGDQVFDASFNNGLIIVGNQNVGVPTDIAKVFDSLNEPSLFDVTRIGASAVDFYGDGEGMNGEIDVIRADSHLRGNVVASLSELPSDPRLSSIEDLPGLFGLSLLDLLVERDRPSGLSAEDTAGRLQGVIDGAIGPADNAGDQVWLSALIEQLDNPLSVPLDVYVRLAALQRWHNAVSLQQARDRGDGGPELISEGASRCAFSVKADHVRSVVSEFEACHVYSLETSLGFYTAEGLIVKNCAALDGQGWTLDGEKLPGTEVTFQAPPIHFSDRCVLSPIPKGLDEIFPGMDAKIEAASMRASKDGPIAAKVTFNDFLHRQSPEFVDKMLGKGRADLFRAGKITVRDLVSGTGRELTLDELR